MIVNSKLLHGLTVRAQDGDLGSVEQLYFDDETWTIRYFTIATGSWLEGRQVLISPLSVTSVDWQAKHLNVSLTMKQVENSPDIDTHKPVSRQHESEYLGYYGYPMYWGALLAQPIVYPPPVTPLPAHEDSHLRCTEGVKGYRIEAADGEIGHVDGFLVDDVSWSVRYLEVATRNWWPGKKVLLSPAWICDVSWIASNVTTVLKRDAIQSAPEYTEADPITRVYEDNLFLHYGLPPYWLGEARYEAALAMSR
jgi:hypothetical protein